MTSQKKRKATKKSKASPAQKSKGTFIDEWENQWHECLPLSDKQLLDVERNLRVSIPRELKTLLLGCNGGLPDKSYFCDGRIEVEIGSLLPIEPPASYEGESLEEVYEWFLKNGYSSEILPFAYDIGNAGIFCLDTRSGEIVYWVQDEPEESIKKVATSITDFFSNLGYPPY